jgi:hypothetical protein
MQVDVKVFLQGFYIGSNSMNPALLYQNVAGATGAEADTISVEIYDETTFALVSSAKTILNIDGTSSSTLYGADGNYYIAVRHRNSILTWSAAPVALSNATPASYDFSTDPLQSMSGMAANDYLDGVYAIYSGDINQDEFIDPSDYPFFDIDRSLGACCDYLVTDLNGDGFVDPSDYPYFDNSRALGIMSIHP